MTYTRAYVLDTISRGIIHTSLKIYIRFEAGFLYLYILTRLYVEISTNSV